MIDYKVLDLLSITLKNEFLEETWHAPEVVILVSFFFFNFIHLSSIYHIIHPLKSAELNDFYYICMVVQASLVAQL